MLLTRGVESRVQRRGLCTRLSSFPLEPLDLHDDTAHCLLAARNLVSRVSFTPHDCKLLLAELFNRPVFFIASLSAIGNHQSHRLNVFFNNTLLLIDRGQ